MRTVVYVDGFNLYYGALKGTSWKWLDLVALFEKVLQPHHDILAIKYFTARVSGTSSDPSKPQRQDVYLHALQRYRPVVEIYLGHFLSHTVPSTPCATAWATAHGGGHQDRGKRLRRQSRRASAERRLAGRLRLCGGRHQRQRHRRSDALGEAASCQKGRPDNTGNRPAVPSTDGTCGLLKAYQGQRPAAFAVARSDSRHQHPETRALEGDLRNAMAASTSHRTQPTENTALYSKSSRAV